MSGRLGCLVLIAWAAGANASPDNAPLEGTCSRPTGGTCTSYLGGGLTSAQLQLLFKPVCAPGTWSASPCASSQRIGTCRFTERTDLEDMGITQTVHVYTAPGNTETSSHERCASGQFDGMSAPGIWEDGAKAATRDGLGGSGSGRSGGGTCDGSDAELLAMNIDELACESDELQFGFRP